jgi:heme oxygenase
MTFEFDSRLALREATRPAHDRVDTLYSRYDLATKAGYLGFLKAQAYAFVPIERSLDAAALTERLLPDWPDRIRSHYLQADLAALGSVADDTGQWSAPDDEASILGAIYVLEGSRLGGAVLLRQVAPGLPVAFLSPDKSGLWRGLTELIRARLRDSESIDRATHSAIGVFRLFEQGARHAVEEQHA